MEVGNRYRFSMIILLICLLDVTVGNITFEAVINKVKRLDMRDLDESDLKHGDHLSIFCNVSGKPGRVLYSTQGRSRLSVSSPFTMVVQTCELEEFFACLSPNQPVPKRLRDNVHYVYMYRKCMPRIVNFDLSPQLAYRGSNVKLTCTVESYNWVIVELFRREGHKLLNKSQSHKGLDKVTFELKHVTCDDVGQYECHATEYYRNINSTTAELQISGCPPWFMTFDLPRQPHKGESVKLTCTTEYHPISSLTISREDTGTVLNSSPGNTGLGAAQVTFDLKNITCDDNMINYICQATELDGSVRIGKTELQVYKCPPKLCWNQTSTFDIAIDINQSTEVTVCLRGFEDYLRFDAFREGKIFLYGIPGLNKVDVEFTKISEIYQTFSIQLKNIQGHDYGQWLFRLESKWGNLNVTINLRPDDHSDVKTGQRCPCVKNTDDHSDVSIKGDEHCGVRTLTIGMGAGLAVSGLVIILLCLLIIGRWRKSNTCSTTKGRGHLDPDVMYSVSYKRIHVDTIHEGHVTMNDDSNAQHNRQVNLLGDMVTYTDEETVTIQGS